MFTLLTFDLQVEVLRLFIKTLNTVVVILQMHNRRCKRYLSKFINLNIKSFVMN